MRFALLVALFLVGFGAAPSLVEGQTPEPGEIVEIERSQAVRSNHTETLLRNGQVLLIGGTDDRLVNTSALSVLRSAELFDPEANTFRLTGAMTFPRWGHTATLMDDGTVLVVGGLFTNNVDQRAAFATQPEIYDPSSGEFTLLEQELARRFGHSAVMLPDGSVLIVGGSIGRGIEPSPALQRYDPATRLIETVGEHALPATYTAASLLPDSTVLLAGVCCTDRGPRARFGTVLEKYDPVANVGEPLSLPESQPAISPGPLPTVSGPRVASSDGGNALVISENHALYFDFETLSVRLVDGPLARPVRAFTAVGIGEGRFLVSGGVIRNDETGVSANTALTALYDRALESWRPGPTLPRALSGHTMTLLDNGDVLIVGADRRGSAAYIFHPGAANPPVAGLPSAGSGGLVDPARPVLPAALAISAALVTVVLATAGRRRLSLRNDG